MTKPTQKELITQAVIKELPQGWENWTLEEALKKWWQTGARGDSLRLTEFGDMGFRLSEIEFYDYEFTNKIEGSYHNYILDLSKKLKCPYFLGVNRQAGKKNRPYIRLYDSKIAMMVSLYGDIDSYLKSIKVKK
jgi:hypothetical protein